MTDSKLCDILQSQLHHCGGKKKNGSNQNSTGSQRRGCGPLLGHSNICYWAARKLRSVPQKKLNNSKYGCGISAQMHKATRPALSNQLTGVKKQQSEFEGLKDSLQDL